MIPLIFSRRIWCIRKPSLDANRRERVRIVCKKRITDTLPSSEQQREGERGRQFQNMKKEKNKWYRNPVQP